MTATAGPEVPGGPDENECGMPWPDCHCGWYAPPSPELQKALDARKP